MREDREKFCNTVQARDPEWAYLGVYERQTRGCWHAHIAVRGWQQLEMLRRIWLAIAGDRGGNLDIKHPRQRKDKNARAYMAVYMAKYIGKDFAEWELNRKGYYASGNVVEPAIEVVHFTITDAFGCVECAEAILRVHGKDVGYRWVHHTGWMGMVSSY
jgi:hypothetical protein